VHPPSVRAAALELIAAGVNDCEISRRTGIPRRTICDWRRPTYIRKIPTDICPRCWRAAKPMYFTAADYAELLGLYLGDGYISEAARTTRLRITLDLKYPQIIGEAHALVERCFPSNRVDVQRGGMTGRCVNVSVYSLHLSCLFPQHGPGVKHARRIALEPWQEALVSKAPWRLLRGLIRTDGSAFINRTGRYEYLSYDFSNRSEDIVDLFTKACDLVGIEYRRTRNRRLHDVRINRRASVARVLEQVGLKA